MCPHNRITRLCPDVHFVRVYTRSITLSFLLRLGLESSHFPIPAKILYACHLLHPCYTLCPSLSGSSHSVEVWDPAVSEGN
jgi:hypothetical protein